MIPSPPEHDAFAMVRHMHLTASQFALAMRFIRVSFDQAEKQVTALLFLIFFVGVSCLVRACVPPDSPSSSAASFAVDLLVEWLPAAGEGLAAGRIALIQIRRRRLINAMVTDGLPPLYAACMRRLATLIDVYILAQPAMRLLRKWRRRR